MSSQQKLRVTSPTGEPLAAAFVLQDDSNLRDVIDNAPSIERGRPQGETEAPKLDALHAGAVVNPPERVGQASDPSTINSAAIAGEGSENLQFASRNLQFAMGFVNHNALQIAS